MTDFTTVDTKEYQHLLSIAKAAKNLCDIFPEEAGTVLPELIKEYDPEGTKLK